MKTLLTLLAVLCFQLCFSQNTAIDKYFTEYQKKYALEVSIVSSKMMSILVDEKDADSEDIRKILGKLSSLKMMSRSNGKEGAELYSAAIKLMPASYETILSLAESERKVSCYTLAGKDGKISELVMIAWQWGRFMILSITGDIDLKEIFRLSQKLDFGKIGK